MNFRRPSAGAPRRCAGTLLFVLGAVLPAATGAAPLEEPHVGGLGFIGPTSSNLGAVYWNPAALGLAHGNQFLLVLGAHRSRTDVALSAVDPATGVPRAGPVRSVSDRELEHPVSWPIGPGSFIGLSTAFGGDRFTLAVASYMPFHETIHFPAGMQGAPDAPTRYHVLDMELRHQALVPALAIRVWDQLRIGFAPGFLFSTGHLRFDEDTALGGGSAGLGADCGGVPCGAGNPAAAARVDVRRPHVARSFGLSYLAYGLGFADPEVALTLGFGVYFRRGLWEVGVSYSSRPLADGTDDVRVSGHEASLTPPARTGATAGCPPGVATCIAADTTYGLPDIGVAGVGYHALPSLKIDAVVRYLSLSRHRRIDLRLVGPPGALEAAGVPEQMSLYRGFRDVWELRLRLAHTPGPRTRWGVGLRVANSAVAPTRVSPAAFDAVEVEPVVLGQINLRSWLHLSAGLALTWTPSVDSSPSVFDPAAATACADGGNNLALPACRTRLAGAARASAAGHYAHVDQRGSVSLGMEF